MDIVCVCVCEKMLRRAIHCTGCRHACIHDCVCECWHSHVECIGTILQVTVMAYMIVCVNVGIHMLNALVQFYR